MHKQKELPAPGFVLGAVREVYWGHFRSWSFFPLHFAWSKAKCRIFKKISGSDSASCLKLFCLQTGFWQLKEHTAKSRTHDTTSLQASGPRVLVTCLLRHQVELEQRKSSKQDSSRNLKRWHLTTAAAFQPKTNPIYYHSSSMLPTGTFFSCRITANATL